MKTDSFARAAVVLSLTSSLWVLGCGSGGGGGSTSPTPTNTTRPSPTVSAPPTATAPAPTATRTPTSTFTPTSTTTGTPTSTSTPTSTGELDIAICAPSAGPFSTTIDNPFFSLRAGVVWVLVGEADGMPLRTEATSLDATELVAGVTTRVLQERHWEDGAIIEISRNYFAQKSDGTVCYFGEDVDIYEAGEIVSHDGAWRAGESGARAGIQMPGNPQVGQLFKQEQAPGVAEDEAELVAAGESVTVGLGTFTDTIRFEESSPLEPGATSEKVYARGVGLLVDDEIRRVSSSADTCGTTSGTGCAPVSQRVDRAEPSFSNPANITNPLFPISNQHSVVQLGFVDGEEFRAEVTLLPTRKVITLGDRQVETLESQYVAFIDGRIEEVAIDWYGQADDGSVWYFGEDVSDYADGKRISTGGTWLAGRDGPVAMIMPSSPEVGDVYRAENIPALVFEEVTVQKTGVAVDGPYGPVSGAIEVLELHQDGITLERKTFAPGYGEFINGSGFPDIESLAIAVPTDAVAGALPATLAILASSANDAFDAAEESDWAAASTALQAAKTAWDGYRTGPVSALLATQLNDALEALEEEIGAHSSIEARQAAVDVGRAVLDFHLRHRPTTDVDRERFEQWARQVLIDVDNDDTGAVRGDSALLERIYDRFAHTLSAANAAAVEAQLAVLKDAAAAGNLIAAKSAADALRDALEEIGSQT